MSKDDDEKQRTGLLNPDAFWDGRATGEADQTDQAEQSDETDVAVVGPKDAFPGQPAGRTGLPPRPRRQPARQASGPRPQASYLPPPAPRPKPGADRPAAEVELDERVNPAMIVALVLLAAVAGFLGWFLIGRHAGVEEVAAERLRQAPAGDDQARTDPGDEDARQAGLQAGADDPSLVTPEKTDHTASITIDSDPASALVFVDDEHRGVTPTTVRGLDPAGEVAIRIEKKGYRPWSQVITLDEQDLEREIRAGLIEIEECANGTGFLYVITDPPGATIELNGKRLPGKTPKVINDVCAGVPHELRLQAAGFRTWREKVTVEPDDIRNLQVRLER